MSLQQLVRLLLTAVICQAQEPVPCPGGGGCPVYERPINTSDELVNMFDPASSFDVRGAVQKMASAEGVEVVFKEFVPLRYRSQVVSGVNYFVRIQVANATFIDVYIFSSFNVGEPAVLKDANFNVSASDPIYTFSEDFPLVDLVELFVGLGCHGCRSKERAPDQECWRLFNASGHQLEKIAEEKAQAMGWNGVFTEFTPVRYATQRVAGSRYFVKVRVMSKPKMFIDALIFRGVSSEKAGPTLENMKFDVDEDAPIDSFHPPSQVMEILV